MRNGVSAVSLDAGTEIRGHLLFVFSPWRVFRTRAVAYTANPSASDFSQCAPVIPRIPFGVIGGFSVLCRGAPWRLYDGVVPLPCALLLAGVTVGLPAIEEMAFLPVTALGADDAW